MSTEEHSTLMNLFIEQAQLRADIHSSISDLSILLSEVTREEEPPTNVTSEEGPVQSVLEDEFAKAKNDLKNIIERLDSIIRRLVL